MVNSNMVNAGPRNFCHRIFAQFLLFFARILRSQNPFKYICSFDINYIAEHFRCAGAARRLKISTQDQCLLRRLTVQQGASPKMAP